MVQEREVALTSGVTSTWDSIATGDSLISEPEAVYGILLTPPEPLPEIPLRQDNNTGISFILTGLFILFLIIALRFHNNIKFAVSIFRNLIETRTRQNVFDDTVRETSLIIMLNFLWCATAGIIGYYVFRFLYPASAINIEAAIGILWGIALAVAYSLFMWWAYSAVGWIFSDRSHAALWVKGFSASQALMTPAFFIFALLGICQPESAPGIGIVAAVVFLLAKLVFIWKGYRIFFHQFSSWVLFLCYLCSLEIVPLILCYRCAVYFAEKM